MHIYTLSFLLVFLPVAALIYYAVPPHYRVFTLFLVSLYFYASISPLGLLVMLASVGADYLMAKPLFLWGKGDRRARALLLLAAAKNILLFVSLSSWSQLRATEMPSPAWGIWWTFTAGRRT